MDERVAATFGDFSPSASGLDVRSDSAATPVRAQRSAVQQTLAGPIQFRDVGLHSGGMVNLRLVPAPIDHGVRFFRTDLYNGARLVLPRAHGVTQTELCTLIANDEGGQVGTVEHLMAALHAVGLTNVLIEIDGPEVPIMDGSSAPFVAAIMATGLVPQDAPQTYIKVQRTIRITDGQKQACLAPHANVKDSRLLIDFTIDFSAECIGRQSWNLNLTSDNFTHQVGAARTFGFAEQIAGLQRRGLAQGGSMSNAIIVDQGQVKNPKGLRFDTEFVRHKTLDAVGDLFIEGLPVIGAYTGIRAGHGLTNQAMRALMSDPANYTLVHI